MLPQIFIFWPLPSFCCLFSLNTVISIVSCLLRGPPYLPFWIDIFYGWSLYRFSIPKLPIISGEAGGEETWISDDSCDDVNNNQLCGYDGGDCCGSNVVKQYCIDCECLGKYKTLNLLMLYLIRKCQIYQKKNLQKLCLFNCTAIQELVNLYCSFWPTL